MKNPNAANQQSESVQQEPQPQMTNNSNPQPFNSNRQYQKDNKFEKKDSNRAINYAYQLENYRKDQVEVIFVPKSIVVVLN